MSEKKIEGNMNATKLELRQKIYEARLQNAKLIKLLDFIGKWIDNNHPESKALFDKEVKSKIDNL